MFGEALLNDGVTFVLFEGVKELGEVGKHNTLHSTQHTSHNTHYAHHKRPQVSSDDLASVSLDSYLWVLLSFLTAPLGGILVGFVAGLLAALITKYAR